MKFVGTRIAALSLGLLAAAGAYAQGKITSVTGAKAEGGYVLHVRGENLSKPQVSTINGGKTALASFNAVWVGKTTTVNVGINGIDYYRIGQFKPTEVRIAIHITSGLEIGYAKADDGWDVLVAKTATKTTTTGKRDSAAEDAKAMAEAIKQLSGTISPATSTTKTATEVVTNNLPVNDQKPTTSPAAITPMQPRMVSVGTAQSRILLEFQDTDVTIILKTLAEQTGSNIVASPEVRTTLTVSLKNVTVEQALDLITKLSGFRYAKIGNTYVVGTASFLQKVLSQEPGATAHLTTTRVVPLASRKAGEIKRTILKALSIDSINESLRVVHPSESGDLSDLPITAEGGKTATPPPTGGNPPVGGGDQGGAPPVAGGQTQAQAQPPAQGAGNGGAAAGNQAAVEGDADYLILIGEKGRVEQAAAMIMQIDNALADMLGVSHSDMANMRPITMTYQVRGGDAEDLLAAIKAFAGPVSIVATPKTSTAGQMLVLHGRPAEVERVYAMVTKIDDVAALGEIVYTVYDVKYADPRALRDRLTSTFNRLKVMTGAEGASGLSYVDTTGAGGQAATTDSDGGRISAGISEISAKSIYTPRELVSVPMKLILSGARETVEAALEMLNAIDLPIPQVIIEARIVDVSKEDILKAGIHWDLFTGGAVKIINLNNSQPPGSDGSPFNSVTGFINGKGWGGDVIATLDKVLNKNDFISRPNVAATDGREAVVFVGDVVRYIKSIQVTPTGTNVEVGEEEVGVKLNVLPRVGGDGSITLEVQPTVSFIRSFLETGTGGMIPITAVRTARSTLRMASGETIAIGGLITEEIRKEVSGIPLLMDLPLIGQLFKRTTHSKRNGEIIIFLTARVTEGTAIGAGNNPVTLSGGKG